VCKRTLAKIRDMNLFMPIKVLNKLEYGSAADYTR
jgi:hypothetical protein